MNTCMFDQITIIGMGLLGGSIGIGCLQKGLAKKIVAVVRRKSAVDEVMEKKAAHEVTLDIHDAVRRAGLVIFAVPISAIAPLAKTIADDIAAGCIVTDVASVKGSVVADMETILGQRCRVVGSHPMAGSEKSGIATADPAILTGNVCVITPTENTDEKASKQVAQLWETLCMNVRYLSPKQHDENVALISHLPHAAAFALMNAINHNSHNPHEVIDLAGPGFRDVTRIAASSPELWTEICLANKAAVLRAVKTYRQELKSLVEALEKENADDLCRVFAEAKKLKDASNEDISREDTKPQRK